MLSSPPLYEEIILNHAKHRRNYRAINNPTTTVEKSNPVCGDRIVLQLNFNRDVIDDIAFQGSGCAISQASASLMTTYVKSLTLADAVALMLRVRKMITDSRGENGDLGELCVLQNVQKYPVRRKCALLAWDALEGSLERIRLQLQL